MGRLFVLISRSDTHKSNPESIALFPATADKWDTGAEKEGNNSTRLRRKETRTPPLSTTLSVFAQKRILEQFEIVVLQVVTRRLS
ncbi:hypothetical protein AVEN_66826-1 [Araneus ventricosus]|uniref:Uncharacterized protein n=1 Tax=Araneus ventricosus TaxID=182803 RepID=A0A4Y2DQG2_ARAVE|nr:hypothetical protein AVEN_66826-1 [Araneus ventricosus]